MSGGQLSQHTTACGGACFLTSKILTLLFLHSGGGSGDFLSKVRALLLFSPGTLVVGPLELILLEALTLHQAEL